MQVTGFLFHWIQSQKSVLFFESKTKLRNCCMCGLLRCSKWIHLDWIPKPVTLRVKQYWGCEPPSFFPLNVVERSCRLSLIAVLFLTALRQDVTTMSSTSIQQKHSAVSAYTMKSPEATDLLLHMLASTYTWIDKLQPPAISINHIRALMTTSCLERQVENYFKNNFCLLIIITTCGSKAFVKLLYWCNRMQQNLLQHYYLRKTVPKNPTWQLIRLK